MQTQAKRSSSKAVFPAVLGMFLGLIGTVGCGKGIRAVPAAAATGHVRGGLSGVAHASIQLYAAGSTGYGSPALPLLPSPVVADSSGDFNLPHTYVCPSPTIPVYLLAIGGDGGKGLNPNLALMAALGPCGTINLSSVTINELTTVAAVYALQPFIASPTELGSSPGNAKGLAHAFATAARLAESSTGAAPGSLPSGATVPVAVVDTLANILASCVDTAGGVASDGSACGTLFAATRAASGAAPTDTLTALLAIARNPGRNVTTLLSLVSAPGPYQPAVVSPPDFSLAIKYRPALRNPTAAAIDAQGNVWITNADSNSVSVVDATGAPLAGSPFLTANLDGPSAVAIDATGNAWVTSKNTSTLSVFTPSGVGTTSTISGLSAPSGIAIDSAGLLWIANSGSNSVSAVTVSGTHALSAVRYSAGGIDTPTAIAVNP